MSLRYIIDGYNIIRHPLYTPLRRHSREPCQEFLATIAVNRLCGSSKNAAIVVFDGFSPTHYTTDHVPSGVQVIFSCTVSADEKIKVLLEQEHNPRVVLVVSDDKEIQQSARLARAKPVSVEEFLGVAGGGSARGGRRGVKTKRISDTAPELTLTQMQRITAEMERIWLKQR